MALSRFAGKCESGRASDRAQLGQIELETSRPGRCEGTSDPVFLPAGQTPHYIGARALLSSIPQAGALLADRAYDADRFRNALIEMGISPCIPSRRGRKIPIPHDADRYRQRHKIENMFARLKAWRRIATRHDRCPILFLSACALAAAVIYWLCSRSPEVSPCFGMALRQTTGVVDRWMCLSANSNTECFCCVLS